MASTYYYTQYLQQAVNQTYESIDIEKISVSWVDFKRLPTGEGATNQAGSYTGNYNRLGWIVKVYEQTSPTATPTLVDSDHVKVTYGAPNGPQAKYFQGTKIINSGKAFYTEINYDNIDAAKKPLVLTPTFFVTLKDGHDTSVTYSPSKSQMNLQTVEFTNRQTFPPIPTALIAAVSPGYDPGLNNGNTSNIHYNFATGQYVGIQMVTDSKTKMTSYYALYYDPKTKKQVGASVFLGKEKANSRGNVWKKSQAILIDAIDSQKGSSAVGNPGTGSPRVDPATVDQPATLSPAPPEPVDPNRWNPPPHLRTKNFSSGLFLNKDVTNLTPDNAIIDTEILPFMRQSDGTELKRRVVLENLNMFGPNLGHIGHMYQDVNTAKSINQVEPNKQWGFRFMYNPTNFMYSNTADNSVDYTLGQSDPATLLAGNMTVSFQLYINRIIDMSDLGKLGAGNGKTGYYRPLSDPEIAGIESRGTEYDIEFLYRVLGGDPIVGNPSIGGEPILSTSSDIGLIKAVPVWLSLNPNYKLFGAVASMTVNHALFTIDMVPMLTTVDITFNRFPAVFNLADTNANSKTGLANYKKFITGTGVATN